MDELLEAIEAMELDILKKRYRPSLYERIKNNGYNYAKIIIPKLLSTLSAICL